MIKKLFSENGTAIIAAALLIKVPISLLGNLSFQT
jgi:hypothetical protein